ncbi:MAG TPA: NDP-sugar synthase [Anaeromyxobacteraceae bacterium]|nr:NDP-sugar synthase [Anaeromyxobacteraceae bacterium]
MGDLVGMVLCAGLGTRLRPLTELLPKPAVPVGGVPLVAWNLALLRGAGVRRAVVNVHHLPRVMARAAEEAAAALGLPLAVSPEPEIAGTGGALRQARPLLAGADEIVVVNGDVLFDLDLPAAIAAHRASGALATMVLLPMPAGARYAAVEVDRAGAVRRIAGRFGPGGAGLVPWHFSGVHVLSGRALDEVPAVPFECDVNRHVYPPLMERGLVRGFAASGFWSDPGTPAGYLAANLEAAAGRVPLARFPGLAPARIGPGTVIEPGAEVGEDVVLGARCRVPAGAVLRRAVVWDGTAIAPGERLEGAVAAGALRVPAAG